MPWPNVHRMAGYVEISDEIARRVANGDLAPGAELPSIRALAATQGVTPSTIARAYQRLATAGIVHAGDRRKTRVAQSGPRHALGLLADHRPFRLAGSDDPALDILLERCGDSIDSLERGGSFSGLRAVWQGRADGAAIHLLHESGVYNRPFAAALLAGRNPKIVHLWRREQGIIVADGNPLSLQTIRDALQHRIAKREFGAGTRVLLDRLVRQFGGDPDAIRGPEAQSHFELALAVASGIADAALGARSAATALHLGFVPVTWEPYELVVPGDRLGLAWPLIEALEDPSTQQRIAALTGYDLADAGQVFDAE
jgi:molybdate-binding protein